MARRVSIFNWWTKSNGEVYTYEELYGNCPKGNVNPEIEEGLRHFLTEKAEARMRQKKFLRIMHFKNKKTNEKV